MTKALRSLVPMLALAATPALAADGVREINQACAVGDGCFSGDSSGFPVTITSPGSYVLTGDIDVPDANTTAIDVNAAPVTIDLNGFAIRGVTSCTGTVGNDFACAPGGTGDGIDAFARTVTVRNGFITQMGDQGVIAGSGSIVEGVHFSHNAGLAVTVVTAAIVRGNTFDMNGATMVNTKLVAGVSGGFANQVVGNTMNQLGGSGILVSGRVADNTLISIDGDGLIVGAGVVEGNSVALATGFGLDAGPTTGYAGNAMRGNNSSGDQVSGGIEMGTNVCGFNTTCP